MHRSSPSIASLAAALAKAQAELVNPEKSLVATISSGHRGGPEQSFRYAPLSSGLDIVRKTLGQHEIATVQARCNSCSRYNLHDGCPYESWSSHGRVMDAPSSSTLSSRAARGRIHVPFLFELLDLASGRSPVIVSSHRPIFGVIFSPILPRA